MYRGTIGGYTCAAKILPMDNTEEVVEAIQQEIKIMKSLNHPNIVKYLGHEMTSSKEIRLYLEYFTATLTKVINERSRARVRAPLTGSLDSARNAKITQAASNFDDKLLYFSLQEVCMITSSIAKGLLYLHSQPNPIVHRDLKVKHYILIDNIQCENIFVSLDSHGAIQCVKIGDFDISKVMEEKSQMTFTKNQGTDGYMAPEVITLGKDKPKGYNEKADSNCVFHRSNPKFTLSVCVLTKSWP